MEGNKLMKFEVKQTSDNRWQVTGTRGYRVVLDNRFDAEKHCNYLNRQEDMLTQFREQNITYYTCLSKAKMLSEQIQTESGEIHILELAIRIKKLINEALP